jgi:hypothetical protein
VTENIKRDPVEIKTQWLVALRSGEYRQGLYYLVNEDCERCCLGVLCAVLGVEDRLIEHNDQRWPAELRRVIGNTDALRLTRMNDDDGKSFAEIADHIEKHVTLLPQYEEESP